MSSAAQRLIDEYDALPQADQQEVLAEMLRRAARGPHDLPTDEEFVSAADRLFEELDRSEQQP
jgi:hypothetical protein